ncbi:hypothetical protein ACX9I7_01205 [Streptomyces sp. L500]
MLTLNNYVPDPHKVAAIARLHELPEPFAVAAARLEMDVTTIAWRLYAARHEKNGASNEEMHQWICTLKPQDFRDFEKVAVGLVSGRDNAQAGPVRGGERKRRRLPRVRATGRPRLTIL